MRVVCDPDAPPSAGAWRPVTITAPEGSLLNARAPAAVAAGNVETSSRVADLVIEAMAAFKPVRGTGTGHDEQLHAGRDEDWTYYETIGGGQGACPDADGPDAVHVAMSNTLNTPVEALEAEFPLRVRELSVLRGSGGAGAHRGGDGIAREIEALEPMRYTLIAERRRLAPPGREGGADGRPGRDALNGERIPGKTEGELQAGDRHQDRDPRRRRLPELQRTATGWSTRRKTAAQCGLQGLEVSSIACDNVPQGLHKRDPSTKMRDSQGASAQSASPPPLPEPDLTLI